MGDDKSDTYNLHQYMNPISNPEKFLNPYTIMDAFTYGNELHVCVFYAVLEYGLNNNDEPVDN